MNTLIKNNQCRPSNRFWFDDFFTREVERIFNEKESTSSVQPVANVWEDEKNLMIELALPGIKKEEVKIQLEKGLLTINAAHSEATEEKERNFIRKEFGKVSYSRSFKLNENRFDLSAVEAKMENGVLLVTLPKKVEEKALAHTIEVK